MVVTMRPKPRYRPICTVTSTMEKTIPTTVASKRGRKREAAIGRCEARTDPPGPGSIVALLRRVTREGRDTIEPIVSPSCKSPHNRHIVRDDPRFGTVIEPVIGAELPN